MLIKKSFDFPRLTFNNCFVHTEDWQYAVELTHQCQNRRHLYAELHRLIPTLVYNDTLCWFQTLNKDQAPNGACLFPGARLQLKSLSEKAIEYGFCFARSSFAQERARCNLAEVLFAQPPRSNLGITRRRPSDYERLLVNRDGWEILYVVRIDHGSDLAFTDLREEACLALQVTDRTRVSLASGPFTWGPTFDEDGRHFYHTYFSRDIVVDSRHMKTTQGAALLEVVENFPAVAY